MSEDEEEFRDLAEKARPLQQRLDRLRVRMLQISNEKAIQTLTEAFPDASVINIRAVSQITPTDQGRGAHEVVQALAGKNITPTHIIIDHNRYLITLGKAGGPIELPAQP